MTPVQQGELAVRNLFLSAAIAAILSFSILWTASAQTKTGANSGGYRSGQTAVRRVANASTSAIRGNPAAAVQSSSANVVAFRIGVLDISKVFKSHAGFKSTMDGMKQQMQTIEQELKAERDRVKQKEEQRNGYSVGSPEWKRFDNELTQMKGDFNVKMTQRQKDFLEQEAKVYYQTYLQVQDAVKYYAQRNGLGLVLRYSGDEVNPNLREGILRAINKPIIYQNQIDITDDIIAMVNGGAAAPSVSRPRNATNPGAPAAAQRRR